MDAECRKTNGAWRTAKSCGPGTSTLVLSFLRDDPRERRWQESPIAGESTKQAVKTVVQGMPGSLPVYLW